MSTPASSLRSGAPVAAEPAVDAAPVRRFVVPGLEPMAATLGEIRTRIDALDARIVALLAERGRLVRDATRFKRDPHQVAAVERQAAVLGRVRALAAAEAPELPGFADTVEAGYRALVAGFVAGEQRHFEETVPIEPPIADPTREARTP